MNKLKNACKSGVSNTHYLLTVKILSLYLTINFINQAYNYVEEIIMLFDNERRYYVYAWYIKNTNEIFYIGKGTGKRYKTRKRENSYFMKMLKSHECDSLIIKNHLTEKEAFELEKSFISFYRIHSLHLTNVQPGGENPPDTTGIPRNDNWKRNISIGLKKFREEHPEYAKAASERMKEFLKSDKGKEFAEKSLKARSTDEFKKSQSIKCKAANNTPEYKMRQSELMKQRCQTEKNLGRLKGENNHNAQSVKQYDLYGNFIKEYPTMTQASIETGANMKKISAVANGTRKTAGGYVWKLSSGRVIKFNNPKRSHINPSCEKAILQYDMNGNLLNEYKSIKEATMLNGFNNHSNIICNLKEKTKHAYGYVWKYKQDNTVPSQMEITR